MIGSSLLPCHASASRTLAHLFRKYLLSIYDASGTPWRRLGDMMDRELIRWWRDDNKEIGGGALSCQRTWGQQNREAAVGNHDETELVC